MKRGHAGLVLLLVLVVAVGAVFMLFRTAGPTGNIVKYYNQPEYEVPRYAYDTPAFRHQQYLSCRQSCMTMGDARYAPMRDTVESCLMRCASAANEPLAYREPAPRITGNFAVPEPAAYGGSVRGIVEPEARAFGGRAVEAGDQSCYVCSCMEQGITSASRDAAERVCRENCGGSLMDSMAGACQ